MTSKANRVRVSTPGRLHFGLLRFCTDRGPSFGGLGAMIDRPRFVVRLEAADRWRHHGPSGIRARRFAERALAAWAPAGAVSAGLHITVDSEIPQHRGLGGGTQLGLTVAAGVRRLLDLPPCPVDELATAVGRGRRSAVGSHGFEQGGLIWEEGRGEHEPLGRLRRRVALPAEWRFVLLSEPSEGLSGRAEQDAFATLPAVPAATSAQLCEIAESRVLPAVESKDNDAFGEAVYQYGRIAGQCFSTIQGGPYASQSIAQRIDRLRSWGVHGVGQSSWGPTVFAILRSQQRAEALVARLHAEQDSEPLSVEIAAPDNQGAVLEELGVQQKVEQEAAMSRRTPSALAHNKP